MTVVLYDVTIKNATYRAIRKLRKWPHNDKQTNQNFEKTLLKTVFYYKSLKSKIYLLVWNT